MSTTKLPSGEWYCTQPNGWPLCSQSMNHPFHIGAQNVARMIARAGGTVCQSEDLLTCTFTSRLRFPRSQSNACLKERRLPSLLCTRIPNKFLPMVVAVRERENAS